MSNIYNSYGVSNSYGVNNSDGVYSEIFCANKKRRYKIFGGVVDPDRFNKVKTELSRKLDGWFPKFNNAFELYLKNGSDWSKVDASRITSKNSGNNLEDRKSAWKDMPQEAIDYILSLPEFDSEIFKEVTGIDIEERETIEIGGKKYLKSDIEGRLKYIEPIT